MLLSQASLFTVVALARVMHSALAQENFVVVKELKVLSWGALAQVMP